jgi:hypothetical protein
LGDKLGFGGVQVSEDTALAKPEVDTDVARRRARPRLDALLFADYGLTAVDQKITLAGIINRISVDPETKVSGRFFMFIRTSETVESGFQITVYDPDGKIAASGDVKVAAPTDLPPPHGVQSLQAVALEDVKEGMYWFEVSYQGERLGGTALAIEYRKQEVDHGSDG